MRALLLTAAACVAQAGFNGMAQSPPMGARTWNEFFLDVNQTLMMGLADGLVDTSRAIWNGTQLSLAQLGYTDLGLDDGWQLCGRYGPLNYSFHDANGRPVVNPAIFPDFKGMTNYIHSLNLTAVSI